MSDGLYDGYRMEWEGNERAKRMARFGRDLCFTCGRELGSVPGLMPEGAGRITTPYDRDLFKNFDLVMEKGRPVPQKDVDFCCVGCQRLFLKSLQAVEEVRHIVRESVATPALKINVIRMIRKILEEGEPRV